jgi:hypothetical protein
MLVEHGLVFAAVVGWLRLFDWGLLSLSRWRCAATLWWLDFVVAILLVWDDYEATLGVVLVYFEENRVLVYIAP